jgi:hypothetical protein
MEKLLWEKAIYLDLFKKFSAFCGNGMDITVYKRACYLPLS